MNALTQRRRALMRRVVNGIPQVYEWCATIAEAQLDGVGNISVNGYATSYTATYTFDRPGYYRIYVIGKGGDGGDGGDGDYYSSGTGAAYYASGGSGGSGGYGGCVIALVKAISGSTITIYYDTDDYVEKTAVRVNASNILVADWGEDGGWGGYGRAYSDSAGSAGSAGAGGKASGSNLPNGNIVGKDGNPGTEGGTKWGYVNAAIEGRDGADTESMDEKYLNGGKVYGGKITSFYIPNAGADGFYLRKGAGTILGNPGAGGASGSGHSSSDYQKGASGGLGGAGGVVIEIGVE